MAQITVTGLEPVLKKLRTIERLQDELRQPMDTSLKNINRKLIVQPHKAKGVFSALATDRQRRAYWAKVRSGEAQHREGVGYVRTHALSKAWTMQITKTPNGLIGEVSNNQPYAKWVQGDTSTQQLFHYASGWKRIDTAAQTSEQYTKEVFNAAIKRILAE